MTGQENCQDKEVHFLELVDMSSTPSDREHSDRELAVTWPPSVGDLRGDRTNRKDRYPDEDRSQRRFLFLS